MPAQNFLNDELRQLLINSGLLILFLGILSWAILRIRSRFREDEGLAASDHEMLTQIRDLHRRGDLSDEEFRSIKSRLVRRIENVTDHESPSEQAGREMEPSGPEDGQEIQSR